MRGMSCEISRGMDSLEGDQNTLPQLFQLNSQFWGSKCYYSSISDLYTARNANQSSMIYDRPEAVLIIMSGKSQEH